MKKIFLTVLFLGFLTGCASTVSMGTDAAKAGNFVEAERLLKQALSEGDSDAWNNLGVVYEKTGRRELAIRAYQMGARYGQPTAQQNLVIMGERVPSPDLAASAISKERANSGLAAALQGFVDGKNGRSYFGNSNQQPTQQQMIFCDSKAVGGGKVTTTCY